MTYKSYPQAAVARAWAMNQQNLVDAVASATGTTKADAGKGLKDAVNGGR
jgi:hypothetical protein